MSDAKSISASGDKQLISASLAFDRRVNRAITCTRSAVNAKVRVNRVRFAFSDSVHGTFRHARAARDARIVDYISHFCLHSNAALRHKCFMKVCRTLMPTAHGYVLRKLSHLLLFHRRAAVKQ
jgi:hypothetical protein